MNSSFQMQSICQVRFTNFVKSGLLQPTRNSHHTKNKRVEPTKTTGCIYSTTLQPLVNLTRAQPPSDI